MPIQFQDLTYLYFEITEAITLDASASIDEAERAVANRRVIEFLDHYDDIDFSRFNRSERQEMNEAFHRYGPDGAHRVHVSDNGLRYLAASCIWLLEQGAWTIPETNFRVDVEHLELQL